MLVNLFTSLEASCVPVQYTEGKMILLVTSLLDLSSPMMI